MKQKGFAHLILIAVVGIIVAAIAGFLYLNKPSKPSQSNDFGCWPPSCSLIPDSQGKKMCEDWKEGKVVEWPECSFFSGQPACQKLCESEKGGVVSGGGQKQTFNTLPTLVKGEFASGVSNEDKNFIIQGISTMDFYLQKWFGKSINKPAGLRVGAGAPTDMGAGSQVLIENGKVVISMETGSFAWKRQVQSNKEIGGEWRPRLVAHEYVHVYQFQNGCGEGIVTGNPVALRWFTEGVAEWLSYTAMKDAGLLPKASIPQLILPPAKQARGLLASFENPNNSDFSAYPLFNMAIDYLMKNKPVKTLDDFCANLGRGMSMPKAFETVFGMTKEKFYENFESYRKTW